jgi:hypothetical protein
MGFAMTTRKPPLAAVPPGARARRQPKTLLEAADGSRLDLLRALRERIAVAIDVGPPPHALPALARQLREIDMSIRDLVDAENGDEIADAANTRDEAWVND